jgi:two-component system chemotaxis family response regulator WspR
MTPPLESQRGRPAPGAGTREVTVLLVDDQPLVGEALRRMLAPEADVTLHHCSDGAQALRMAAELDATVILLDLLMPGADGLALLQALRQDLATAAIPIVVLSALGESDDKARAFARGASDYLVKFPERIELVARLRMHTRAYLAQRERDEAYRTLEAVRKQLEQSNAELRRLTHLDPSTGVANRRWLEEQLNAEWRRAKRNGGLVSLALVGMDGFTGLVDSAGVTAGEECLRAIAHALRAAVRRGGDLLTRYREEQFAALLPEVSHAGACKVANALHEAATGLALAPPGAPAKLTVSVGVVTVRPRLITTANQSKLLTLAESALRRAEREGGNTVAAHDE